MASKKKGQKQPTTNPPPPAGPGAESQPKAPPTIFGSFLSQMKPLETNPENFNFSFGGQPTPSEDNALARFAQEKKKFEDQSAADYDRIAERDKKIDELAKQLEQQKTEIARLNKANNKLRNDVQVERDAAKQAEEGKKKLLEEQKKKNNLTDTNAQDFQRLYKDIENKEKEVTQKKVQVGTLQNTIKDLRSTLASSEAVIQELRTENEKLSIQDADAISQLEAMNHEFEEVFKDFGERLTPDQYMGKIRELVQGGKLKHQDSETGLDRRMSADEGREQPTRTAGANLLEQMREIDVSSTPSNSGDEDGNDDDNDDDDDTDGNNDSNDDKIDDGMYEDDPTLNALGLGKKWTSFDYINAQLDDSRKIADLEDTIADFTNKITFLMQKNSNLNKKIIDLTTSDDDSIRTRELMAKRVEKLKRKNDELKVDIGKYEYSYNLLKESLDTNRRVNENLIKKNRDLMRQTGTTRTFPHLQKPTFDIKLYEPVETPPVAPTTVAPPAPVASAPTVPAPTVPTITAPTPVATATPSLTSLWWNLPVWQRFIALMLLLFYFYQVIAVVNERHMWLAANDLTRHNVVRLGMGSENYYIAPLLYRFENWMRIDRALLG